MSLSQVRFPRGDIAAPFEEVRRVSGNVKDCYRRNCPLQRTRQKQRAAERAH